MDSWPISGFRGAGDKPDQLPSRLTFQLKLALTSDCGCQETLSNLQQDAKSAGLTGAEIDAALAGRSFEARTAAIIAFVCALKAENQERIDATRTTAVMLGITSAELSAIADEAKQLSAVMPS